MGKKKKCALAVPVGFEPVLRYPDGVTGAPVAGAAKLVVDDDDYEFDITDGVPALPLKGHGSLRHSGWDIPTRYAIDADGQCWMDNAHGHPLSKRCADHLLGSAENESDRNAIRRALGIEFPMPEWARTAIAVGFTPPDGWTWRTS